MEQDSLEEATDQMQEMECDDTMSDSLETSDEKRDEVGEIPTDIWNEIRDKKRQAPQMFVSGWEEDEEGIQPGDKSDPAEQFLLAAENGDIETLKQMFELNPRLLEARDQDYYTPLHRSAYNHHTEACKWLLSVGANPELRTETGWSVLHSAAFWGAHEIVGLLLSHGVDVNSHSNGDVTPLHLAISSSVAEPHNQLITIQYLLSAPGVDMGAVNKAGETPLMLAGRASHEIVEMVEHFLRRP